MYVLTAYDNVFLNSFCVNSSLTLVQQLCVGYKVITFKNPYLGNTCVPFQHWACSLECATNLEVPAREEQIAAARELDRQYDAYVRECHRQYRANAERSVNPLPCTARRRRHRRQPVVVGVQASSSSSFDSASMSSRGDSPDRCSSSSMSCFGNCNRSCCVSWHCVSPWQLFAYIYTVSQKRPPFNFLNNCQKLTDFHDF